MIKNILFVGSIGSLIFLTLIIIFGLSGIFDHIRDEEGRFRKEWNKISVGAMSFFIIFVFGILFYGNIRLLSLYQDLFSFTDLWINSFGIFMIIHLVDLIILDYLIIVKWHPDFLTLPDTDYYTKLKPHWNGFLRGIPFGAIVSAVVAVISYFYL